MTREELIKLALGSEELQDAIITIQREVQSVGLSKETYVAKLQEAYQKAGFDIAADDAAKLLDPGEENVLSDEELSSVSGGCGSGQTHWANWCQGYNKNCPECTSWCDVYCAP